jgi:hypothetical protein
MSHQVHFTVPKRELGRSDVEFIVKGLGTLKVSRGSLVWFHGKTHVNGLKIAWDKFDAMMRENATRHESR